MDKKNLDALLSLLEDPDNATFEAVANSLTLDVTVLEILWRQADNEIALSRLEWLIQRERYNKLEKALTEWQTKKGEILEGAWIIANYQYPELSFDEVDKKVATIVKDVWLELRDNMTPREEVAAINHVLFGKYGIQGDTQNIHSFNNILINNILHLRKGNHIGLAILYISIAQKLSIPVFGVPLLRSFSLAYLNDKPLGDNVVFYIDPFNGGKLFNKADARCFLEKQQIPFDREYILPCDNEITIQMLVAQMMMLYEEKGMKAKAEDMSKLLDRLGDSIIQ